MKKGETPSILTVTSRLRSQMKARGPLIRKTWEQNVHDHLGQVQNLGHPGVGHLPHLWVMGKILGFLEKSASKM